MTAREPEDNPYVRAPEASFEPVDTLSAARARDQAALLREAVRYHDYRYYVRADPVIADRTYDALFERLEALEHAFDLATETSPTQRVGGEPVDGLETVEHVAPMRSLDHSDDPDDVREFDRRVRAGLADTEYVGPVAYVCEPKFDGISIEVVYDDGVYTRATTRGDGSRGDDITEQVRTIPSVPERLRGAAPDRLAVRGEAYMPRDAFGAYNRDRIERGEDPFANPRNATAGTLRQLDPSVVAERPLSVMFFGILETTAEVVTQSALYERLPEWGLRTADRTKRVTDIEAAIDYRDRLLAARDELAYEVDGAVLTLDNRRAGELLGATARAPRWAFAYKFPARSEETTIREIAVQVGRTGRLTPVALLDPVDVGGVTVSRASLHNPDEIERLGVDVNDRVRLERAGDVIPYVTDVIEHETAGSFALPDRCPACDTPVERDGPLAFCPAGLQCPPQLERTIEHYASRAALDIEGLGEERISQLIDAGLLTEPADLYELAVGDLTELEGWGEQSAENLIAEIAASTTPPVADFLTGLGVPDVGDTTARALAAEFGSVAAIRAADPDTLQQVPDIGPAVAASIRSYFDTERTAAAVDRLLEHVAPEPPATDDRPDALADTTVVFTGTLERFTRTDAQSLVETHGGTATSSVSGATDYLVAGDNPGQRKQTAAADNDVPVLSEHEFLAMLADAGVELPGVDSPGGRADAPETGQLETTDTPPDSDRTLAEFE